MAYRFFTDSSETLPDEIMKVYDYLEAKVLKEDWDLFTEIMNNTDKIDINFLDISDNRQGLTETFEELATLRGHMDYVVNMKIIKVNAEAKPDLFHDNKHALASCSFDYTVKIWDINHYNCLFTLQGHLGNVNAIVQFNSDYSQIVTCSYDKTIKVWEWEK